MGVLDRDDEARERRASRTCRGWLGRERQLARWTRTGRRERGTRERTLLFTVVCVLSVADKVYWVPTTPVKVQPATFTMPPVADSDEQDDKVPPEPLAMVRPMVSVEPVPRDDGAGLAFDLDHRLNRERRSRCRSHRRGGEDELVFAAPRLLVGAKDALVPLVSPEYVAVKVY